MKKLINNRGSMLFGVILTAGLASVLLIADFTSGNGWEKVDRSGVDISQTLAAEAGARP